MSGELVSYLDLVKDAHNGKLKLPAFQRDWKWTPSQVILLFDSIRQKFPIGSFLFLTQGPDVNLSPRSFKGSTKGSEVKNPSRLVLDGQQRLTAGIELFYGTGTRHYFLSIFRLYDIFTKGSYDIESKKSIEKFLYNLDAEDAYLIGRSKMSDPESLLIRSGLLFTPVLLDDTEFSKSINKLCSVKPELRNFCDYVLRPAFKPSESVIIPVSNIGEDATVEAICRIFATLNSTGKILTPFEIVAAVLYPDGVNLQSDVEAAKELFPYFSKLDANGDILLQTIALFDGKSTKKSSLPKTITKQNYSTYFDLAAEYLEKAGKLMTERAGLGLDRSGELLVYPVIFPPMAWVLKWIDDQKFAHEKRASAERKIERWFFGSILSRRYQQSTHDKQARDKNEIVSWISNDGDSQIPDWLKEVFIPRSLEKAAPNAAVSKLLLCIFNQQNPSDPLDNVLVGVSGGAVPSAKHHIFPTRFMPHIIGWKTEDSNNSILNIMYVSEKTNATWNNIDPSGQIRQTRTTTNNEDKSFKRQFISDEMITILEKDKKGREDFFEFISLREKEIEIFLNKYGFQKATVDEELNEDDE
jgi:Protein of unknown function DUF262